LKGQHIRFIPKNRLSFDYISPEGPLHLIYEGDDSYSKRLNNWKISAAVATPAAALAYFTIGSQFMWAYPMLLLPTVYQYIDSLRIRSGSYKAEA